MGSGGAGVTKLSAVNWAVKNTDRNIFVAKIYFVAAFQYEPRLSNR